MIWAKNPVCHRVPAADKIVYRDNFYVTLLEFIDLVWPICPGGIAPISFA
jgi:hypothetical protein